MLYIVNVSGGLTSYEALRRCKEQHPKNTIAIFADTLQEDEDLYRFLDEQEEYLKVKIIRLADGRTPFETMFNARCLSIRNTAPCSKYLKQQLIDRWINDNIDEEYTRVFGLDWSELGRVERIKERLKPITVWCPLTEKPYITKEDIISQLHNVGIEEPNLYKLGFTHNNCGGGCVKAGQKHFAHLLKVLPNVYAKWEHQEESMRSFLGKDISILKRVHNGIASSLTLHDFRLEQIQGKECDNVWGGCGCFID